MSELDIDAIKARLDKAHTEWGPWKAKEDSWNGYSVVIDDNGPGVSIIAEQICQGEDEGRGDAEFIAHAPEDIRALLDEVKAVRDAVARHPDVMECSEYSDDEPVSCGWKHAYEDVVHAMKGGGMNQELVEKVVEGLTALMARLGAIPDDSADNVREALGL